MFFAVTMGLGGLGLAYMRVAEAIGAPSWSVSAVKIVASLVFAVILLAYLAKWARYPAEVAAELNHVIKINFFAAAPISMIILSALWKSSPALWGALFYGGGAILTALTFYTISFWINRNLEIKHSNPAWFIPIVGNLIVVALGESGFWMWYYFAVGMFFYLILFAIIFYRILFHDQLAVKFMPTLFIMIAPPAIGFLGFLKLTGANELDAFSLCMLHLATFFALLVAFMYKNFMKLKFFLSWWAFTFPTAALSLAWYRAYEIAGNTAFLNIAVLAFAVLCMMIVFVGYHTIKNMLNGSICAE